MATSSESTDDRHFYSSFVVEYIVPNPEEHHFKRWYQRLVQMAKGYEGYLRTDLCPPLYCEDGVVKWYSIIHFTTPAHLNHWLQSDDRKYLMEDGQEVFSAYRFKSFTTGLEGWFSQQAGSAEQGSLGPPPWKQVLAVVLGLYPTLIIQGVIFSALGLMQSWPQPTSLVVNNLITSSILTWVVMPIVTRGLSFWLRPAYRLTTLQTNAIGTILVFAALGFMVSLFNFLQL
ncbi:MAG: hypothetical protein ACFCVD_21575 [Nodosilinea sp.]